MTTDPGIIRLQERANELPDEPPTLSEQVDRLDAMMGEITQGMINLTESVAAYAAASGDPTDDLDESVSDLQAMRDRRAA